MRSRLAALVPRLPRGAWWAVGGYGLSAVGSGFVLPFNAVYLHTVRGFSTGAVGLLLATVAAAGLVAMPAAGALGDRFEPNRVMAAGAILAGGAWIFLGLARSLPVAFAAAVSVGLGQGLFLAPLVPLLARLVSPEERQTVFSLQYMLTNVGVGFGALLGALLVAGGSSGRFLFVYVANAVTFVVYAAVLLRLRPGPAAPSEAPRPAAREGFRAVLGDKRLAWLFAVNVLVVTFGYAQLDSSVPLYAKVHLRLDSAVLGPIFAANNLTVVLAQLPVNALTRSWRRTRLLACLGLVWAGAWLIGGTTELVPRAAVLLAVFYVVFALGECLLSPALPPLAAEISPPHLLGRYTSVVSLAWPIGTMVGPAIGAWLVGLSIHRALWPAFAACALLVTAASLRFEKLSAP